MGIRMALGARGVDVLKLMLKRGMKLALAGVAAGLLGAAAAARLMSRLLYDVSANDPATFFGVAMLLIVVALLACWIPSRRAMRIDPMTALRHE